MVNKHVCIAGIKRILPPAGPDPLIFQIFLYNRQITQPIIRGKYLLALHFAARHPETGYIRD